MNRNTPMIFDDLPVVERPRSTFKMPQEIKLSGSVGSVIPFYNEKVLPGDTMRINTSMVLRMSTPIAPFMDNIVADIYYFFVPNRLVWSHWQNFMGESEAAWYDPGVEYTIPQIVADSTDGWAIGGIADYLGYPVGIPSFKASALPFRAYAKICEDWFRSEANSDPLFIPVGDSDQTGTNDGDDYVDDVANGGKCFKAGKLRDYFVSALPQPQFGEPTSLSLTGDVPVFGNGKALGVSDGTKFAGVGTAGSDNSAIPFEGLIGKQIGTSVSGNLFNNNLGIGVLTKKQIEESNAGLTKSDTGLVADLGNTPLITINELRMAFQVQKMQETLARSGNRYIEIIKGLFGVTSPDARLQRSEYLGGSRVPVQVNQVLQTSQTATTPQGTTAAYSLTADSHFDFEKSFTEHGYVMGMLVLRYKHTYQQGIDREFLRKTRNDFYNPIFANIGEQGIKNAEIYAQGPAAINAETGKAYDEEIFGYQEAWADYRYKQNRTAGYMRSQATDSLDFWHLGDDYSELPHLSDEWIRESSDNVDRVLTVTESAAGFQFFADMYVENKATRVIPHYSIPGLMDHH